MSQNGSTQFATRGRTEMGIIQLGLVNLAQRKRQLLAKRTEIEARISPIKLLPADILHHIFGFCLEDNQLTVNDRNHPAAVLSHVCEFWRELVLSYSPYWSNIRIHTPSPPHSEESGLYVDDDDIRDNLSRWMVKGNRSIYATRIHHSLGRMSLDNHREGQRPLSSRGASPSPEDVFRGECAFDFPDAPYLEPAIKEVFNLRAEDVPLLTRLELVGRSAMPLERGGVYLGPRLRSLHLMVSPVRLFWNSMPFNWAMLTDLSFNISTYESESDENGNQYSVYFGVQSALSLLRRCPALVTCSLNIYGPDMSVPSRDYVRPEENLGAPVELEHLRSFSLRGHLDYGDPLEMLRLPSLRELRFINVVASEPHRVWPWIRKYGNVLTSFEVCLMHYTLKDLVILLQSVPSVRSLNLHFGNRFSEDQDVKAEAVAILDSLAPQLDDNGNLIKMCLCPHLRQFTFVQDWEALDEHDVVRFVKAKRSPMLGQHGISVIEDVRFSFVCRIREDIRCLLLGESIDVDGLALEIIYDPWQ